MLVYNNPEKSQNSNISPIWRESPAEGTEIKICTDLWDVGHRCQAGM